MQHTQTYKVKGMHCASCAHIITKTLQKKAGVMSVEVNYGTENAAISFDSELTNPEALSGHLTPLGYSLVIPRENQDHTEHTGINESKSEKLAELAQMRTKVYTALPLALVSIFIMGWDIFAQFSIVVEPTHATSEVFHHLLPLMATYVLFVVGKPYLLGVYRFFRYGKANMDTLIGIGTLVAYSYSVIVSIFAEQLQGLLNVDNTYYDVTIVVITFIALGKYLEARAKLKTGDAIEKLLNLQAKTALILQNGKEVEVPIERVEHGILIIIKPGAKIPVDGVITEGASFIDEAMVTGEPMPVKKKAGDSVIAGTINTDGAFIFKATKVGGETLLAQIIRMVEEAQGSRAPIQALADKISSIFVPVVIGIACTTLIAWLFIGISSLGFAQALSYGLTAFVGVLVIACPCALGLATPTAIIVGVGKGAREGILIKDAATLETLHKADVIVVDKTGTITKGKPELTRIVNYSKESDDRILQILASLESRSEHPVAHAVSTYARDAGITLKPVSDFAAIKGKGIRGTIEGIEYVAGSTLLISDMKHSVDMAMISGETAKGKTPVILATDANILAIVFVADSVKPGAAEAIMQLHQMDIRVIMLSGDDANTARAIGDEVGIDEVIAGVLPDAKLAHIKELQEKGYVVAMAGDGVNDAPALAAADVGIAMGTGTDVAIETAGITLLHGDITKLVKAVRLSQLTMRGIKQNLFWAFAYNLAGIPIAAGILYPTWGILLSPVIAGLAMALSSVSVVSNSLRLKSLKL